MSCDYPPICPLGMNVESINGIKLLFSEAASLCQLLLWSTRQC